MIWRTVGHTLTSRISDTLTAEIVPSSDQWIAKVTARNRTLWIGEHRVSQELAKHDVCHWIGKTMAQFSNALAAGYVEQDDGA